MSGRRHQFYVEFLGWMECRGIRGAKYVEPVVKEMRRRQRKMQDRPPKLTIQASKKELKISQDIEDKKKRFIKKIKFPTIPGRDITYVYHSQQQEDIVACIFLGYMPRTDRYVHVHVYRFDGPSTAATFYRQMSEVVDANLDRIRKIEIDLANKGEIDDPRLTSSDGMSEPHTTGSGTSSAYSDEDPPAANFSQDDIDADLQSLCDVQEFDNITDELKYRLKIKKEPILLPPKDYDTISRAHGNIEQANMRRCLNMSIVGDRSAVVTSSPDLKGGRNTSTESGVDLTSPVSDSGSLTEREYLQQQQHALDVLNHSIASDGLKSSISSTPGTPPTGRVYPVKSARSPPMSPNTARFTGMQPPLPHTPTKPFVRQNSYNSAYSDGSRKSQHSDNGDAFIENNAQQLYKQDSGDGGGGIGFEPNDIYAKPMKKQHNLSNSSMNMGINSNFNPPPMNNMNMSMNNINNRQHIGNNNNSMYPNMNKPTVLVSPRIDYPPADYYDEEDINQVKLRASSGLNQRYQQPNLTRSMPPELIRSEMAMGAMHPQGQRNFREMGNFRRTDSPTFVGNSGGRPNSGNNSHFLNTSQWRPTSGYK